MTSGEHSRLDGFFEAMAPWRNGVLLVVFVGGLVVAFQVPSARPTVAHAIVLSVPSVLVLLAFTRLRAAGGALSLAWLAVGLGAAAASAVASLCAIDPAPPLAEGHVSLGQSVALPIGDVPEVALEVVGHVRGGASASVDGRYELALSRGDATPTNEDGSLSIDGRLYREVRRDSTGSRGRGAPSRTITRHQTDRHLVALGSTGDLQVTLVTLDDIDEPLRVSARAPFALGPWWWSVLALLCALSLTLEALSARAHSWAPLTAVVGLSLVLGAYVATRYDPDEPLITALGALLTATLAGGGGGLVLGFGAALVGRRLGA